MAILQSHHRDMLDRAVRDAHPTEYPYVLDHTDKHVVYEAAGKTFKRGYKTTDQGVSLADDQEEVRRLTTYKPVAEITPKGLKALGLSNVELAERSRSLKLPSLYDRLVAHGLTHEMAAKISNAKANGTLKHFRGKRK
jgi:hypothetical protein